MIYAIKVLLFYMYTIKVRYIVNENKYSIRLNLFGAFCLSIFKLDEID